MPEWLGPAAFGAIVAVLGYVGKQLAEWFVELREEEKKRRSRLVELIALIRAGDTAWKIQCENRDRLVELLKQRQFAWSAATLGYDRLLSLAHPEMTAMERDLYDIVRAYTVHTFQPLNEALLEWLRSDTDFRVYPANGTAGARLAKYLADLEAHLILWQAKFNAWIPNHPERALVYLVDEQRHGLGFPRNGIAIVGNALEQRNWLNSLVFR